MEVILSLKQKFEDQKLSDYLKCSRTMVELLIMLEIHKQNLKNLITAVNQPPMFDDLS